MGELPEKPVTADLIGDMDLEYAAAVADRAIRLMAEQSVPSTPRNFSIWFD
jgi:diguanylate cyclase